MVEVALVRREVRRLGAVRKEVPHADRDLREGGEDVELRERERGEPVEAGGVAQRHEVEPAAAALAPRDRAELAAELAQTLLVGAFDLGRERPRADARDVRLRDADDLVDSRRADPDTGRRSPGDRGRRRDERVRPVVEVEKRRVRALEQHGLAVAERAVDEQRRVRDVGPQPLCVVLVAGGELLELERRCAVHPLQPDVLLRQRHLQLLAQDLRVEEILDADAQPKGLVRIGRADAALRRPDLELSEPALDALVDRDVPGHDHVRVRRQVEAVDVHAPVGEVVKLVYQDGRVDDAAGADHAFLAAEDPRGDVLHLVGLAVGDDLVSCVRPAVVTADEIAVLGEQVDDLPLALVAPLRADDHGRGHVA